LQGGQIHRGASRARAGGSPRSARRRRVAVSGPDGGAAEGSTGGQGGVFDLHPIRSDVADSEATGSATGGDHATGNRGRGKSCRGSGAAVVNADGAGQRR